MVVAVDIERATELWHTDAALMLQSLPPYVRVVRELEPEVGCYEMLQDGAHFVLLFEDAIAACEFCLQLQQVCSKASEPHPRTHTRSRALGGEKPMCTAAYGGKGFKERTQVSGERPVGAASVRQESPQASCQAPPKHIHTHRAHQVRHWEYGQGPKHPWAADSEIMGSSPRFDTDGWEHPCSLRYRGVGGLCSGNISPWDILHFKFVRNFPDNFQAAV